MFDSSIMILLIMMALTYKDFFLFNRVTLDGLKTLASVKIRSGLCLALRFLKSLNIILDMAVLRLACAISSACRVEQSD